MRRLTANAVIRDIADHSIGKDKAAALAHLGRLEEARAVRAHYLTLEPHRTPKICQATTDYGGCEGGARYFEGLRLAGLPDG